MIWQPVNLTKVCPPNTQISACSNATMVYFNLLVHLYSGSVDETRPEQCDKDYGDIERDGGEYDFIVVGAGAAGCVVANRLTENPDWKVLLIEAGPEEPDITSVPALMNTLLGSNIDWNYSAEPNGKSCLASSGGRCACHRGKTMGGSTSINNLVYIRGNRIDFNGWAKMGNKGWSYKDVLPFFRKSERNMNIEFLDRKYHGMSGEQYVSWYPYVDKPSLMLTKAYNQRGLPLNDYNGAYQLGAMQAQTMSLNGERVSTNKAFIQPIRNTRSNLVIETNSEAIKILIDQFNNACGIVYIKNGEEHTVYTNKEVIISAGAINSPKLLMLSGIGPKDHLERLNITVLKNLPVGENLQDHVTFNGVIIALPNGTATTVNEKEILRTVKEFAKMKIKNGPLASNGPGNSAAYLKTNPYLNAPDVQFQVNAVKSWKEYIQDPVTTKKILVLPTAFYDSVIVRPMNLVPKSRGVLLLNETDPNGPPLIFPNYLDDNRDFVPLLKGGRFLLSLENTKAFRSHGAYFVREQLPHCKHYEWGTDEYFICLAKTYTASAHHYVGTCKMGPEWDENAVVDNELRVYGVERLRVIDASIMPVLVHGNTHAPSIMIGERGVDYVIKYWRKLDDGLSC